jgi:hypothetical protein
VNRKTPVRRFSLSKVVRLLFTRLRRYRGMAVFLGEVGTVADHDQIERDLDLAPVRLV